MMMQLVESMAYLFALYGSRNAIHLSSLDARIAFMALGVRNLDQACRKGQTDLYGPFLASVFSRTCAVVDGLAPSDSSGAGRAQFIAEALSAKYPQTECTYCHRLPCACPERRNEFELVAPDPVQLTWSLSDWQAHLGRLYGARNTANGLAAAFNRLYSEVVELIAFRFHPGTLAASVMRIEYALELADMIARTIAIANLLGIDLEHEVDERYKNGCHTCQSTPCDCPPFTPTMRIDI